MKRYLHYIFLNGLIGFFAPFVIAMTNILGETFGHKSNYEMVFKVMVNGLAFGASIGLFIGLYKCKTNDS